MTWLVSSIAIGDESSVYTGMFWTFDLAAKEWCENKYLKYLNDDRFIFKDSTFLYTTEESKQNAINNISRMRNLHSNYNIFS